MKLVGPLARAAAFIALALAPMLAPSVAIAGPAEVALLESYIGAWRGRGQLIGAEKETVVCRLTISKGKDSRVNYSGRCAMAGTNLSVNGTLAYVDAKRRFEAAMTTNAAFSGIAVGQKSGKGIVFNLKERERDDAGKEMTITSSIKLVPDQIAVEFDVVFNETGDTIHASVPFSK